MNPLKRLDWLLPMLLDLTYAPIGAHMALDKRSPLVTDSR